MKKVAVKFLSCYYWLPVVLSANAVVTKYINSEYLLFLWFYLQITHSRVLTCTTLKKDVLVSRKIKRWSKKSFLYYLLLEAVWLHTLLFSSFKKDFCVTNFADRRPVVIFGSLCMRGGRYGWVSGVWAQYKSSNLLDGAASRRNFAMHPTYTSDQSSTTLLPTYTGLISHLPQYFCLYQSSPATLYVCTRLTSHLPQYFLPTSVISHKTCLGQSLHTLIPVFTRLTSHLPYYFKPTPVISFNASCSTAQSSLAMFPVFTWWSSPTMFPVYTKLTSHLPQHFPSVWDKFSPTRLPVYSWNTFCPYQTCLPQLFFVFTRPYTIHPVYCHNTSSIFPQNFLSTPHQLSPAILPVYSHSTSNSLNIRCVFQQFFLFIPMNRMIICVHIRQISCLPQGFLPISTMLPVHWTDQSFPTWVGQ